MVDRDVEAVIIAEIKQWKQDVLSPYCEDCEGYCCSSKSVIVAESDIERWRQKTSDFFKKAFQMNSYVSETDWVSVESLLYEPESFNDGVIEDCSENEPYEGFLTITEHTPGFYKVDFSGGCPFFDEEECICIDYEKRPNDCRTYPVFYAHGALHYYPECELLEDSSDGWQNLPDKIVDLINRFKLRAVKMPNAPFDFS